MQVVEPVSKLGTVGQGVEKIDLRHHRSKVRRGLYEPAVVQALSTSMNLYNWEMYAEGGQTDGPYWQPGATVAGVRS